MRVYIRQAGARINKEGRRLVVRVGDSIIHTLFLENLEQLVLIGKIECSASAIQAILRNSVDTVFLSKTGQFLGRFTGSASKNVFLREIQYQAAQNKEFTVNLARRIVIGKITNQLIFAQRIKRSRKLPELKRQINQLKASMQNADKCADLEQLRGVEGSSSRVYFSVFSQALNKPWNFEKRIKRPPTDPVNACLSLLYSFLRGKVNAAIEETGMDPYFGFMHQLTYGRTSLVFDIMEEFRTPIVDTLVVSLFNLKAITSQHFENQELIKEEEYSFTTAQVIGEPPTEATSALYQCKIKESAVPIIIKQFERKLSTEVFVETASAQLSYENVIKHQAQQFRRYLEGKTSCYQAFVMK